MNLRTAVGVWTGKQGQGRGQYVSCKSSRPFADGGVSQRQREAMTGSIVSTKLWRRLDHSPMGGISQRQSESMTGSLDLVSASRSLAGERHFTASERIDDGKPRRSVGISIA